jgi:Coenzyme PQQ synthesis protein D (PqqD)
VTEGGKQLRLRSDRISWREIDDEVVAVDVATSTYVSANASGKVLWRALADGATHDELVAALTTEFGIDRDRAAAESTGSWASSLGSRSDRLGLEQPAVRALPALPEDDRAALLRQLDSDRELLGLSPGEG